MIFFSGHNSARFDYVLLLNVLLELGFAPRVLHRGCSVLSIDIEEMDLHFIDSYLYLSDPLDALPARFGFDAQKTAFPHRMNDGRQETYEYRGPYPPLDMYLMENESEKSVAQKTAFLEAKRASGEPFHFATILEAYCVNDCVVLAKGVMQYTKATYALQEVLEKTHQRHAKVERELNYFSPWQKNFCTSNSFG